MHSYLSSIGFSNIKNRRMLEPVYKQVLAQPTCRTISTVSTDTRIIQLDKDFGDGFGISLVGEMDLDGSVSIEYYFPYVRCLSLTDQERIFVEKHGDKRSYAGVSEDYNLGMTLIFFATNVAEYERYKWMNISHSYISSAYLSALSVKGKIILEINKNQVPVSKDMNPNSDRSQLIEAARQGDSQALENLTLDDMDIYSQINKRIKREDILSIVETNFMPYGIETEHYSIIAKILECELRKNVFSNEEVYVMSVITNGIIINLAINKKDLLGEPAPGRRFKGEIWLQGKLLLT
jgi:hypothetical protein